MSAYEVERRLFAIALAVILSLAMLVTCGCGADGAGDVVSEERFVTETQSNFVTVITDKTTGCQYLMYAGGYGSGLIQLTDQYGHPLLADGYVRGSVTVMSMDEGE